MTKGIGVTMDDTDAAYSEAESLTKAFRDGLPNAPKPGYKHLDDLRIVEQYLDDVRKSLQGIQLNPNIVVVDLSKLLVGITSFPSGEIPGVTFVQSNFTKGMLFRNITFLGTAVFTSVHDATDDPIEFREVRFSSAADFRGVKQNIALQTVTFKEAVDFSECEAITKLNQVVFCEYAQFRGTHFKAEIFPLLEFRRAAIFDSAEFENALTQFGPAMDTQFLGNALFEHAKFHGEVDFNGITFPTYTSFKGAEFFRPAYFKNVIFQETCDFNDTYFHDTTLFSGVKFHRAPTFHNADLHRDTSFTNSKFYGFSTDTDRRAYRRLRELMIQFKASLEEANFFAYEQRTLANLKIREAWWSWEAGISRLYDRISGYGQNIGRPFIFLLLSLAYFGFLFWLSDDVSQRGGFKGPWAADFPPWAGLTLQNIFYPFGFFGTGTAYVPGTGFLAFLSILQSLACLTLITLWLLAIRRRFRRE